MVTYSVRDEIVEMVNKLFIYTDNQDWDKLQNEVFSGEVWFDMSSAGGSGAETSSKDICARLQQGFAGLDAVHHQAGNYLVDIQDPVATVFAYATATHYKASALKGNTRQYTGSYQIKLMKHSFGWRIYEFVYLEKFKTGNPGLD